jgi:wyosine [tRNA(Phe)-imidazoG37] synthetase (radical SAM superfamily)
MVRLTKLFNSPTGEMYKDVAIMKAIKSAIDTGYKEPLDIKQYAISLKDLGSPTLLKNLPEILEYIETSSFEKMEEINQEADKYI